MALLISNNAKAYLAQSRALFRQADAILHSPILNERSRRSLALKMMTAALQLGQPALQESEWPAGRKLACEMVKQATRIVTRAGFGKAP